MRINNKVILNNILICLMMFSTINYFIKNNSQLIEGNAMDDYQENSDKKKEKDINSSAKNLSTMNNLSK